MTAGRKSIEKVSVSIVAIVSWTALILQLYIMIANTPGNGMTPMQAIARFLIFFTVLTNLLVAVYSTTRLLFPSSRLGRLFSKASFSAAVALYILVVGLTYNIILRKEWDPQGLQKIADELLHVIVPVLFIIYWFVFAAKNLQWKDSLYWLIYPAVYLAYALLRGAAENFYPYPFIDVNKLGYGLVIRNAAGLLILFVLLGLLIIFTAKKLQQKV